MDNQLYGKIGFGSQTADSGDINHTFIPRHKIPMTANSPSPSEEDIFPEVYRILFPLCEDLIGEMERNYGDILVDNEVLMMMADEVVRRSGMSENSELENRHAITAMARGGRGYDRSALGDIAMILLLQQIFGGRRRPRWRRGWH